MGQGGGVSGDFGCGHDDYLPGKRGVSLPGEEKKMPGKKWWALAKSVKMEYNAKESPMKDSF